MTAPPKRRHHVVDHSTDNWDEDGDYIVGKGRPPKTHQWKPGQSGNPGGPKAKPKLTPQQAFDEELMADFNIRKNGEEVPVNVGSFVIGLLKKSAADGTVKAQQILLELYRDGLRRSLADEPKPEADAREQEIIASWLEEVQLSEASVVRKKRVGSAQTGDEE